jgi:FKBP-type peptidyl-prolyl cis-trans isomerase
MKPIAFLSLLLPWLTHSLIHEIKVTVVDGPSKTPATRCYNHEMVEKGDLVVIHFNATYHESSPSGVAGQFITGSHEHDKTGSPLVVPVGHPGLKDGWDLALLGLCEGDRVALKVPPEYVQGKAFAGKKVPDDAIVNIDVHIVDILVESEDEDYDSSDSDDGDEL